MKIIELPFKVNKPILACGADMKGAFTLARGREAFLFDGFGDLGDPDNLAKYERSVKAHTKKLGIKPSIVACDLHPGYFSSKFAESFQSGCSSAHLSVRYNCGPCTLYRIQHHEAHVASAIVDNNIKGSIIGVAFDGTGYGSDGNIWGGEFFVVRCPLSVGRQNFRRIAHLEYVPMPGGDAAVKEPWRMAASYLYYAFGEDFFKSRGRAHLNVPYINKDSLKVLVKMIDKNINSPLTSSAGRLFDAAGSIILAKARVSKEAELPIELERLVSGDRCGSYKFRFRPDGEGVIIDIKEIIKGIVKDLSNKRERQEISSKFHNTMADVITKTVLNLSKKFKVKQAVLSGGVFQNKYLTAKAVRSLTANDMKVYTHSNIATNDSGIPIGQTAIANARG